MVDIMSTSIFRNKNLVRPKKKGKAKRQRISNQRKRLTELGVPAATVTKMNIDVVRDMLKHPKKVAAQYQAQTESA